MSFIELRFIKKNICFPTLVGCRFVYGLFMQISLGADRLNVIV